MSNHKKYISLSYNIATKRNYAKFSGFTNVCLISKGHILSENVALMIGDGLILMKLPEN